MLPENMLNILICAIGALLFVYTLLFILIGLRTFGIDAGELLFRVLERKSSGKRPFRSERKSRQRTQELLSDVSLSAKEKCFALNDEIRRVDGSIFVSREWKKELHTKTDEIIIQNKLGFEDLFFR
mgnify:CR=1 FL=1